MCSWLQVPQHSYTLKWKKEQNCNFPIIWSWIILLLCALRSFPNQDPYAWELVRDNSPWCFICLVNDRSTNQTLKWLNAICAIRCRATNTACLWHNKTLYSNNIKFNILYASALCYNSRTHCPTLLRVRVLHIFPSAHVCSDLRPWLWTQSFITVINCSYFIFTF